jgi:hypothetical protein
MLHSASSVASASPTARTEEATERKQSLQIYLNLGFKTLVDFFKSQGFSY